MRLAFLVEAAGAGRNVMPGCVPAVRTGQKIFNFTLIGKNDDPMGNVHIPLLSLGLAAVLASCTVADRDPADRLNVFNGTGYVGNTYPGATVPYGAVQLSPDTDSSRCAGYHYSDSVIRGFSHTHLSGTGCPDFGDFLVTPALGPEVRPLPFTHDGETARPGYYRVDLGSGISVELTATPRVGVHRYHFQGGGQPRLRVDGRYGIGYWMHCEKAVLVLDGRTGFTGERRTTAWAHHRDVYADASFSVPYERCETVSEGVVDFIFPQGTKEVTLSLALSGVSVEGARGNRLGEVGDASFDEIRLRARDLWRGALSRIKVSCGPEDVFYTYFYHTFQAPVILEDIDGSYRAQDGRDRTLPPGRHFYSTLSLWDTFRSWHPLQTILDPPMVGDIVQSMLDDYGCRGELPIWPLASFETGCMIGYHGVSVIADAWLRGIRSFDGEQALSAMIRSSDRNAANTSDLYNFFGYVPADMAAESVSKTLEFSYDDWCIARMAESLGHDDIASLYDVRALRYRNLFDPQSGFMRGKKVDGNWNMPLRPLSGSSEFTEATPWQYRFFMPHDTEGMVRLMGGPERMAAALDSLFTFSPEGQERLDYGIDGIIGQYAQGNEPGHHLPWLFCYVGKPSRTQEIVRRILTEFYRVDPDGICGNEDCGQMSAWYVLASLGLYPACPGTGEYLLTAPLFKEAVIALGNGRTLTIKADNPSYAYIRDVTLNGVPVRRHFVTYDEIMEGGELRFSLSPSADHSRDDLPAPYSLTREPFASKPYIGGDLELFGSETLVHMGTRTPGAVIRYTLDGSEPTPESRLYEGPFPVVESCTIKAKAFGEGMQPSRTVSREASSRHIRPFPSREGTEAGVRYTYHEANFVRCAQLDGDPAEGFGVMLGPQIGWAGREDHFGYIFSGFIDIPSDGNWTFSTTSDDGSELWIDGMRVVGNDGSHAPVTVEGDSIPLSKGLHPFRLLYFDDTGDQVLIWRWKMPGSDHYTPVPSSVLFH